MLYEKKSITRNNLDNDEEKKMRIISYYGHIE